MTKLELVTREVIRIVDDNVNIHWIDVLNKPLSEMEFNTISGRHEIECFFAIEFEQEQVDAWTTVQNIIDDVMNLWTSPITDPTYPPFPSNDLNDHVQIGVYKINGNIANAPFLDGEGLVFIPFMKNSGLYGQSVIRTSDGAIFERRFINDWSNWKTKPATDPLFSVHDVTPEIARRLEWRLAELAAKIDLISTQQVANSIARTENNLSKSGIVGHVGEEAITPSEVINRIEREDVNDFRKHIHPVPYLAQPTNALDIYQKTATKSAIYPGKGTPFGLMYAALGLAEAGEVQNKVKKAFRDDGVIDMSPHSTDSFFDVSVRFQPITPERRAQIIKELGGALWYIAAVCDEIGATMSEVALQNLDELCGRGERNTLRGDGDNR